MLRNCPPEDKKQDVLLRKAAYHECTFSLFLFVIFSFSFITLQRKNSLILKRYAYIQANVDFLALEQLEELKLTHPPIKVDELDDDESDERKDEDASKGEEKGKEDEKEDEKQEEEEEPKNDLGDLGFGGGYPYIT